jgi:Mg-chelatase subunit ChlD
VPALGASGQGTGGEIGLGGGGGTASFFGTGGKGQRFAFIVDVSGSMGQNRKLEIAMRELARSVDALPDFAFFHIILFESKTVEPPMQVGWMRARRSTVRQVVRWLGTVEPNGGTEPRNAFLQVFSLDVRPDVIFFLTDGIFNDISLEELAELNARGKRVIINTVGFGASGEVDQTILRSIASQSGGEYRFVASEAGP